MLRKSSAAIQSIDKDRWKQGRSLGFLHTDYGQDYYSLKLFRMLAPRQNGIYFFDKNSSLLSTITVVELFRQANILIADTYRTMEFLLCALISVEQSYWIYRYKAGKTLQR